MQYLKADTAVKVVIGPVVAVGDGFTPVTTLAVSSADEAEVLKHDASAVTDVSGNTFAAIASADGYYNLTITAGQLDTEGMMTVLINDDSLCLPVRHDYMVVNANVFDSLYAAATTDYLEVDAISGGVETTVRTGTAQAGAATTITLDASASSTDEYYRGTKIYLDGGTGSLQSRIIASYVGSTKVATIGPVAWVTTPDNTTTFKIYPDYVSIIDSTNPVSADTVQLSGDATAADNAESFFDGTGYAGTNNVIPTVTDVTNQITTAQINAEMLDVLETDTFAELSAIPAATSSLRDKITFLFMFARNRMTQTNSTATLLADDTTTAVGTSTVGDDGTTATRNEWS